jgi:hypothetical protein
VETGGALPAVSGYPRTWKRKVQKMKVKVESTWHGGASLFFLLILPDGRRFEVNAGALGDWSRDVASRARSLLEMETGISRSRFRFVFK